ncbi:MAG: acylneuraminate cytidylyltransferase family protein [Elusimicrobia bacterium]|nr:acylneuraminate cytidylyltransferase family protein [Elusimicrobiota bacterium]
MIGGKSVLAIIPARGGSKGVPRKNLAVFAGQPLIVWTIKAAQGSAFIDRLILSSDDAEIIATAKEHGCEVPFVRPRELALDDTPGVAPVLHAVEAIGRPYDYIAVLQATSPLRTAQDIDACLTLCDSSGAPSCVTVAESGENPYWSYFLEAGNRMVPVMPASKLIPRRQELPKTYRLNGAVYVSRREALLQDRALITPRTIAHTMPRERSLELDTPLDAILIAALMEKNHAPL